MSGNMISMKATEQIGTNQRYKDFKRNVIKNRQRGSL